ncbi:MAG: carboxypeptidase-like regulatory domain-containing protein [Chloroflexia bacterium]|nr:carboxypeptidase-like regulatory domain-containing protein [Chloroflexia bacterium]
MKKFSFVLLGCFIGFNLSAQTLISGYVRDSLNNPVPFASIYLSNTTIGTTADELGAYKLKIPQNGQYDLTITCIGYKFYSKTIHAEGKNIVINAILRTSTQTLNEITVTARDKYRKQNYSRFIRVFLGESKNSKSCSILNPEDLRLHYDSENKKLTGYSVKPLIIENRALGYKIILS